MLTEESIELVRRNNDIVKTIEHFNIDLKLKGSSYTALCPFHKEKTPSFSVNRSKGIFKCFGCGVAGDAIKFIMLHLNISFIEAIENLAFINNITLEYITTDVDRKKQIETNLSLQKTLSNAQHFFQQNLYKIDANGEVINNQALVYLLEKRKLTIDSIIEWQLGLAVNKSHVLTEKLKLSDEIKAATELGVITQKEKEFFDTYRNRIIFPIQNLHGEIIGFGGRLLDSGANTKGQFPKYINSSNNVLYNKSEVLYGIYQAIQEIRKVNNVIIVEGYTDVITFHQRGLTNTVATCGTALTIGHIRILKKYCNNFTICRDADAAGTKASLRDIDLLISHDISVSIVLLPEGEDPDSFGMKFNTGKPNKEVNESFTLKLHSLTCDAIIWKADFLFASAKNPNDTADAISNIVKMLAVIPNKIKQHQYIISISKKLKIKQKLLENEVENNELAASKVSDDAIFNSTKKEYKQGFYSVIDGDKTGYYFPANNGHFRRSNFVIKPLMHIVSKSDDKRMFEIDNGSTKRVIDLASKSLISVDQFRNTIFELPGNNIWSGSQANLMTLLEAIGGDFEECYEIKKLGWQPEGFFAFSDGIISGNEFIPSNEQGIVSFKNKKYYLPSSSIIYNQSRFDDDEYESDRFMIYKKTSISFKDWVEIFHKVYERNNAGMIGVAVIVMALFRDVIFQVDNNCPLISVYGEKGSGKSKYAESLASLFNTKLSPLNLFHATDFAFANRLSRSRNLLMWFDEFNDTNIAEERFEAVKAAYDGVARERGKGGNKNKTEILKSLSTLILSGQYISSKDDNSALTRCLIIPFQKRQEEDAFTQEEISRYEYLKQLEAEGLNGLLVELLNYRKEFENEYSSQFSRNFSITRQNLKEKTNSFNERVLRNYTVLLTCMEFLSKRISLPFTFEYFQEIILQEIIRVSIMIENTDSLTDFWNTVAFLIETGKIEEGNQYKIERKLSVKHSRGEIVFEREVEVISIRLNTIYKLYAETCRRTTGKSGMPFSSIEHYLTSSKAFIGTVKSSRFPQSEKKSSPTSCHVFKYQDLGVILDREKEKF